MKKNLLYIITLVGALCSCNDFLDKEPLDAVPTDKYLLTESDLAAYSANLYDQLPSHTPGQYNMGVFVTDNNSDNQAASNPNSSFVKGETRVAQSGGAWDFGKIRNVNYFIDKVRPRLENGELNGTEANNKHYLGEMYFFRAYIYYTKLVALGDFPILKNWITEDYETVREASKRRPRNEVARFILQDLDSAYYYMKETPPMTNRLTKDCAALLKSRVALFEGTWEKYHKGTARVPGGPGWPGAQQEYNAGFSIDIDKEVDWFLEQAMDASAQVADRISLTKNTGIYNPDSNPYNWNPYFEMFSAVDMEPIDEVLFWRAYSSVQGVTHSVSSYLCKGGGDLGYTRSLVDACLMKNGLPIYAPNSGYAGDVTIENVKKDRDDRLQLFMGAPSDCSRLDPYETYKYPKILEQTNDRCPTGYTVRKFLTYDPAQVVIGSGAVNTYGCLLFRSVEANLNYIEACYEKNGSLDPKAIKYWKEIRSRAGVSDNIDMTIAATDLSKENDWAKYSAGQLVDPTLYNIRRERRVELMSEGTRMRDLKRWRALDQVENYQVEGFNLWGGELEKLYVDEAGNSLLIPEGTSDKQPNVSNKENSSYLRVNQIVKKNNLLYDGYTWIPANYLEPISAINFTLTSSNPDDLESSTIYQNPGWSKIANEPAIGY